MPLPAHGLAISCFALQLLSALQPVTASADADTGADGGADKPPSKSPEPLWIQPSGEWCVLSPFDRLFMDSNPLYGPVADPLPFQVWHRRRLV